MTRALLLLALLPLLAAAGPPAGLAQVRPYRPSLPSAQPERLDPDQEACLPARIEAAYRSHLLPWQDQPASVQQRLQEVQAEMTRASLARCLQRGLISPEAAAAVTRNLQLDPPASGQAVPSSGARP
ncbi:MAG: hypothetical protein ACK5FE_03590 [Cyanobacteriota bacterium]|jgi:hypothetical protein